MSAPLKHITIGWKGLDNVVNEIIDRINVNEPQEGAGIRITETSSGKLIAASASLAGSSPSSDSGGGISAPPSGTADWHQLTVIDNSSGHCVEKTLWYWGTAAQ